MKNKLRLPYIILVLSLTIILIVSLTVFSFRLNDKKTEYYSSSITEYNAQIDSTLGSYFRFSEYIYETIIIEDDYVLNLISEAYTADESTQAIYRQDLYDYLIDEYEFMKDYGFRQFQFIFPDSTSFLRLHMPSKFDDSLYDVRYSIRTVNENYTIETGFEEGRIFNGYRYVYPLSYNDEHIGSVEISISLSSVINVLSELYNADYCFMISKEVVDSIVFDEQLSNYETSFVSDDFYTDLACITDIVDRNLIPQAEFAEFFGEIEDDQITGLDNFEDFGIINTYNDKDYEVLFSTIENIQGEKVGYFISIQEEKGIEEILSSIVNTSILIVSVIIGLIAVLILSFRLNKTKKIAEKATSAKSDFLANMSHEIRTPMNAIIGLSRMLSKTDINEKQKDYIDKTIQSADNLLNIINDILDFSKIEAGKMNIENIEFNLEDILINVGSTLGFKATEKNIEFVISHSREIPNALIGDPLRITQVLINLANNAIKFTVEGEVTLNVEVININFKNTILKFTITDTGIGIEEEKLKTLFEAFYQADSSTTRDYGGTGLGLSISNKLVQALGGTLKVESQYGKGSSFSFKLNLEISENSDLQKSLTIPNEISKIKALIIDDNHESRKLLNYLLLGFGIVSKQVSSGTDAIELLKTESFSLVLLDQNMPVMDGYNTWENIKKLNIEIPKIIMLMEYGNVNELNEPLDKEIIKFINKPISESALFNCIMDLYGEDIQNNYKNIIENTLSLSSIKGAKILVAEDNEINQFLIKELLEDEGLIVEIAENGLIAFQMANNNFYDLILMDLQMPVQNGYESTQNIRKLGHDLPIIALSAAVVGEIVAKVRESGMNGYISKPLDVDKLFIELLKWIPKKNVQEMKRESLPVSKDNSKTLENPLEYNSEIALKRLGNKTKLYNNLLKQYKESYKDYKHEIQRLVDRNEYQGVLRSLHTLKGLSESIGSLKTKEIVSNLVNDLKKDENNLKSCNFSSILNRITEDINFIDFYLLNNAITNTSIENTSYSKIQLLEKLDELIFSLKHYDAKSNDNFNEIKPSLQKMNVENLEALTKSFNNFDYELAFKLVKTIKSNLEVK